MGGDPAALLRTLGDGLPHLGERLARADWNGTIDAIGHVPYGWRTGDTAPGLFKLGDQAGVIPSLAGEGMGLALASADGAVRAWRHDGAGAAPIFQRAFARRMGRPFGFANLVWRLGENPRTAAPMTAMASLFPPLVRIASRATRIVVR